MSTRRIAIGFTGGGSLSARVDAERLQELLGALDHGGWYRLAAEDGTVTLYLAQVVYVREEAAPQVGFGA